MARVAELTAAYENFMLVPQAGPGVCVTCFNLIDGFDRCYACTQNPSVISVVAPISYSVAHEQLHHALASYKRLHGDVARRITVGLSAVLWRYLERHEGCVAAAAGVDRFPVVTTVPSSIRERDPDHALATLVGELAQPSRQRYERLLVRSAAELGPRQFSTEKFLSLRRLDGEPVLLIDDTWTTGANAQSAAAALRASGSGPVAAIVIGRHVNRSWHDNNRRLSALEPFTWERCAVACRRDAASSAPAQDGYLRAASSRA